ncbi:MAG: PAS domain S-box protein [Candidatus Omnitrophota bacterium]
MTDKPAFDNQQIISKIIDLSGSIIVQLDSKGRVVFINKTGLFILSYAKEEVIGKDWFSNFLPKGARKDVEDVFKKMIEGKAEAVEYYENPILTKEGKEKVILWHNAVLNDEFGNIIGTLGSGSDITEYKSAIEKLEETQDLFDTITENTLDLIAVVKFDIRAPFLFASKSYETVLGYKKEELLGTSSLDRIRPEDRRRLIPLLKSYVIKRAKGLLTGHKTERMYEVFEYSAMSKDGRLYYFECTANIKEDKLIFISKDITDRKKIEKEIVEMSKFPMENPTPVLRLDINGKVLYKNQAVALLLKERGISEDDTASILPAGIIDLIEKTIKENKTIQDIEVVLKEKVFSYTVVPVIDGQYVNLYASDITARKTIEEDLKSKMRELERFHDLAVGRELKMIELKKKIAALEERLEETGI